MNKLHDVVYILKNDYDSEELRYSIRSICKNFKFRKLVFVGGGPDDITPDIRIYDSQPGPDKWSKSSHSLKLALSCDDLTDDIWLFNDDFFMMKKPDILTTEINGFGGTLERRVMDLRARGNLSSYARELEATRGELLSLGKDTLNFALHIPMLVNRADALALFLKRPNLKMFRSFYGNYYKIPCTKMSDVKVYDPISCPDLPMLSTTDAAFNTGEVGRYIRRAFPDPCKYERQTQEETEDIHELYTEDGDEIHNS